MRISSITRLDEIPAKEWNDLNQEGYPFLRHEFLNALERCGCLDDNTGWYPQHMLCRDDSGRLIAAVPLYLKDNSFGEFVFDWSWADAYQRHGLSYYPKLVAAIPFTPATGPRLLLAPDVPGDKITAALIERILQHADALGCSSAHWLFPTKDNQALLDRCGLLTRLGCQFHWHNRGYHDFTDFVAALTAKKRKNINRERRLVAQTGLELRIINGRSAQEKEWAQFYQFYTNTFLQRGRLPPLSLEFFLNISATMGEQVVLVLASEAGRDVAGAISYVSPSTLYGRHWGCLEEFANLHFEVCYYQGIEYCIANGLQRFEPGAQGEHKIWRGFLPTITYSAHWLAHAGFSAAIADFLRRENPAIEEYARQLGEHSPFRRESQ